MVKLGNQPIKNGGWTYRARSAPTIVRNGVITTLRNDLNDGFAWGYFTLPINGGDSKGSVPQNAVKSGLGTFLEIWIQNAINSGLGYSLILFVMVVFKYFFLFSLPTLEKMNPIWLPPIFSNGLVGGSTTQPKSHDVLLPLSGAIARDGRTSFELRISSLLWSGAHIRERCKRPSAGEAHRLTMDHAHRRIQNLVQFVNSTDPKPPNGGLITLDIQNPPNTWWGGVGDP